MRFLRAFALVLLAACGALSHHGAYASDTPAIGGAGGKDFRATCPDGQFLTGLDAVVNSATVGAITPLCAPFDGKDRLATAKALSRIGTGEGEPRRALCGTGSVVAGMRVARTDSLAVKSIQLTCRAIATSAITESVCVSATGTCKGTVAACPDSEAATGVHGRADKSIHALGLVCGPRPEPRAAPVTESAPPPAGAEPKGSGPPPGWSATEPTPAPATGAQDDDAPPPPAPPATAPSPDKSTAGSPPPPATAPPPAIAPPAPGGTRGLSPRSPAPIESAKPTAVPAKKAAKPDADGKWRLVPVFFGTDRAQIAGAKRLSYGYERARTLEVGRALVSVPKAHEVPNVERPWAITIPGTSIKIYEEAEDPEKHFTMREIKAMSQDDLVKLVKERLKGSKDYKDQALVFVHGYNTSFDNAVYRTAQIAHDLNFDGAPFLYSWPSRGEFTGYSYDATSNEQAEPYLREFVDMVVKKSGAKQVSLIAHSMGNRIAMRVLRELRTANVKINQIILAAPDVDRDTFSNIATELKGLSKGITLYAASNDRALMVSKTVNGGVPRAGDVPASGPVVLQGMDTIDITALSTDFLALNHSSYAERTALMDDIAILLKLGTRPPGKRIPTLTKVPLGAMEFWRFPGK